MKYEEIKDYLSAKLDKYLEITNDDKESAIILYEANIQYSSQVYIIISIFETIIKNLINVKMKEKYGEKWLIRLYDIYKQYCNNPSYGEYRKIYYTNMLDIRNKKRILIKLKEKITNDSILEKMPFSFITNLFSMAYQDLWEFNFSDIFNNKLKREDVFEYLSYFNTLKNQVMHNEAIVYSSESKSQILEEFYSKITEILNIINPNITKWMEQQINFNYFIKDLPSSFARK